MLAKHKFPEWLKVNTILDAMPCQPTSTFPFYRVTRDGVVTGPFKHKNAHQFWIPGPQYYFYYDPSRSFPPLKDQPNAAVVVAMILQTMTADELEHLVIRIERLRGEKLKEVLQ